MDYTQLRTEFALGLPENATAEQKEHFAYLCLHTYKEKQWSEETLDEYFADDFRDYSEEDFAQLPQLLRRDIRDLLLERGVWVEKGRNIRIADALFRAVHDEGEGGNWNEATNATPPQEGGYSEATARTRRDSAGNVHVSTDSYHRRSPSNGNIPQLFKAYVGEKDKFNGSVTDNFERKYKLFEERCEQAAISEDDMLRAFSVMLCGLAMQYYLDNIKNVASTITRQR